MSTKECQYCLSEIPSAAKKCRYCHEWLENIEDLSKKMTEAIHPTNELNENKIKRPFQEILISFFPFHYSVNILVIMAIFFAGFYLIWSYIEGAEIFIISFAVFMLQAYIAWFGILWFKGLFIKFFNSFEDLIDTTTQEAESIYTGESKKLFNPYLAIIAGLSIGLSASIGEYVLGTTPFLMESQAIYYLVFETFIMFWSGAAIYTIFVFSLFILKLGQKNKIPFDESLALTQNTNIVNLGNLHLKTALLAIVPLILGIVARLIGPWEWHTMNIMWYSLFGVIVLFYIYIPLNKIHFLMKMEKDKKTSNIQRQLVNSLTSVSDDPSSQNLRRYFELVNLEKNINEIPTWPFDAKNVAGLFLAVLFPIITMLMDKYLL